MTHGPTSRDFRPWARQASTPRVVDSIQAGNFIELLAVERAHAAEIAQRAIDLLAEHGRCATPMIRDDDPKREILDAAREIGAGADSVRVRVERIDTAPR